MNPLKAICAHGQSVWLDTMSRSLIGSGELKQLIERDGLTGVTTNPAIFEKAIAGSADYDSIINTQARAILDAKAIYESIAIREVQEAADLLFPVYERSARRDGYVSLEVSPFLAHDTTGTLAEARRLWQRVARPNVMIKIPGTPAGIPAVQTLIAEGVNVNVTLLFRREFFLEVAEAFVRGIELRVENGGDPTGVASVASFFVSRVDTLVDGLLAARIQTETDRERRTQLKQLEGQAAIANAKQVYDDWQQLFGSARWQTLAGRGAQPQRLLWASTSTKNPAYRDVMYVEGLIGRDTVNTLPAPTFAAFRDHGVVAETLSQDRAGARRTIAALAAHGIDLGQVADRLLNEGLQLFMDAFDRLLGAVERKRQAVLKKDFASLAIELPEPFKRLVDARLENWRATGNVRRLWGADASLWSGGDEARWLGWLDIARQLGGTVSQLQNFAATVRAKGYSHALLLGMGGSSLGPEVLKLTFGAKRGYPKLEVLDSTDPAQVRAIEERIDLANTLFIVSSKSGSTLEPNIFKDYFFARLVERVGPVQAAEQFVAITDPGSQLERDARRDGFASVFSGVASVGGRYSVLSMFGMVPLAASGIDVERYVNATQSMVHACAAWVPPTENPGVQLGVALGELALKGRDKLTIVASPGIFDLGAWLEQLVAESTGKSGLGIIPVDRENVTAPAAYGADRLFVYLRLDDAPDAAQDSAINALARAGHPVVRIQLPHRYTLGAEFFRWEIATAVAGAILGINPFNQPDVEASKIETKKLTDAYEHAGKLPSEAPVFVSSTGIAVYADADNAKSLRLAQAGDDLATALRALLARLAPGDYFAILAYLHMSDEFHGVLQDIRHMVRDATRSATCLGFGPRFLHSTGQAYKGGPNSGVFLQITGADATDLGVPGRKFTFGVVKAAQARGDLQVLIERRRRALRIHLPADTRAGLRVLRDAVRQALIQLAEAREPSTEASEEVGTRCN
ncbi:MAG: bifunctional transaldolase/phosoglucose isomerase [Planctomycetota bacterium]